MYAALIGVTGVSADNSMPCVRSVCRRVRTAAPMLGILGTVLGIIKSFGLLGASVDAGAAADPTAVATGIAQALYTTAFGLTIALLTLFPYAIFRACADRAFTRLETFTAVGVDPRPSES